MKKLSCVFALVILMNIIFSSTVFGKSEYTFNKWKGVIYPNCQLRGITGSKDFVGSVSNISLSIDDESNLITVKGEINYDNKQIALSTKGKVYITPGEFYNGNQLLIDLEDTDQFDILSFSIEQDAKDIFLLIPNRSFVHKTVVRMVLLEKESNTILHVEDIIENEELYNDIKQVGIQLTETTMTPEIMALEQWYTPYLPDNNQKPVEAIGEKSNSKFLQHRYLAATIGLGYGVKLFLSPGYDLCLNWVLIKKIEIDNSSRYTRGRN